MSRQVLLAHLSEARAKLLAAPDGLSERDDDPTRGRHLDHPGHPGPRERLGRMGPGGDTEHRSEVSHVPPP